MKKLFPPDGLRYGSWRDWELQNAASYWPEILGLTFLAMVLVMSWPR